jgi:hypothetical protein
MHHTLNGSDMTNAATSHNYIDRLRQLSPDAQPPYNWQEFRRRARIRSSGVSIRSLASINRVSWRQLAAAAALLAVVCGIAVWGRVGGGGRPAFTERTTFQQAATGFGATMPDATGPGGAMPNATKMSPALVQHVSRGQDARSIESWLATLPREPVVVHVGTRAAVARLEDRIAQVDDWLTAERLDGVQPERLAVLQRERVRLVGSLAQVRYAEVVASELP